VVVPLARWSCCCPGGAIVDASPSCRLIRIRRDRRVPTPGTQSSEHCLEQSACLVEWLFHWQGGLVVAPEGQSLTQAHRADSYAPSRPPRPTPTSTSHGTPIGIAITRRLAGIQVQSCSFQPPRLRGRACVRRITDDAYVWPRDCGRWAGRAPNGGVDVCPARMQRDGRAESLRCTRGRIVRAVCIYVYTCIYILSVPYIYILYIYIYMYCTGTVRATAK